MLNMATVLETNARLYPDKPAIIQGDRVYTFKAINDHANRVAQGLRKAGVCPGDKVALSCLTNAYFVMSYYGILKAGGVVVSLNPLLKREEIARNLEDAEACLYMCHDGAGQLPMLTEGYAAFQRAPSCRHFCLIADTGELPSFSEAVFSLENWLETNDCRFETVQTAADDPCNIIFTSGTTGRAKGAELTHANYAVTCLSYSDVMGYTSDDVILVAAPLFSVLGQTMLMGAGLYAGAALVLQPRFDPERVLTAMERHEATVFSGVPTMFHALLHYPGLYDHDLGKIRKHWRKGIVGGAPVPPDLVDEVESVFGVRLQKGYGLSETTAVVATTRRGRPYAKESVGVPMWGAEIRIVDEFMNDKATGEAGEIIVRGPMVMRGYYGQPDANVEAFRGGWFHTGDVGMLDTDGNLHILDRIKDMIIRAGFNVYPCQVEAVLMRHPDILMAGVVGVPDEKLGEEILAYVVLRDGASLNPEDVVAWGREHLAGYAYPRRVKFLDRLPLGPTNKILKSELRKLAASI